MEEDGWTLQAGRIVPTNGPSFRTRSRALGSLRHLRGPPQGQSDFHKNNDMLFAFSTMSYLHGC